MQVAYFNFTKVTLTFRTDKLRLVAPRYYIPAKLLHEKVNSILESPLVNLLPKDFWPPACSPPA